MQTICVFSGSNPGARPEYRDAAVALGREIGARGLALVFGGSAAGLMQVVADAALAAGAHVTGVFPDVIPGRIAHAGLSELRRVGSMHERKAAMAASASAFVALPGGLGTLEETFEVLTWAQLGLHAKPVALLDVAGYFAPLIALLDHAVAEGFVRREHRDMLLVGERPGELLERCAQWRAPGVGKWLDASG